MLISRNDNKPVSVRISVGSGMWLPLGAAHGRLSASANVVIAGVVRGNADGSKRLVFRGLGPSLAARGVPEGSENPTLELRKAEGVLLISNNGWQDNPTGAAELTASGPRARRRPRSSDRRNPVAGTALLAGSIRPPVSALSRCRTAAARRPLRHRRRRPQRQRSSSTASHSVCVPRERGRHAYASH